METFKEFGLLLDQFAKDHKEQFNELDGAQGDGDLGITVVCCGQALAKAANETENLQQWFNVGGKTVRKEAPSTMGILIASALIAVSKSLDEKQGQLTPNDWIKVQETMINEIQRRGGAQLGDKTILDAFIPASDAFASIINEGGSLKEALAKATVVAKESAESTAGLVSKIGRSSWLGERAKDNIDGGAWLCYKIYDLIERNL
ncbi:dihydroxyacetone kinase subunit L [Bacillus sp. Marseille-P3661]|uniref:dihydroxyacetone kinase subunit L n=1 Tax=Bacillus sp. Marseille-P3661 TaxID=1936234 RepID=UPI0015E17D19|nr:dihydroxyacetone kinase subunit L [Bacillus sp. Marseille-P3661]